MSRKKGQWPLAEIKRFGDLIRLKNDETQPLDARTRAANELKQWIDELPLKRVEGLVLIAQGETKQEVAVRAEAIIAVHRLTTEEPPESVCCLLQGCDDQIVCAQCGKGVSEEAHSAGHYPGFYCDACCPGCSLIPRESLVEVPMTSEELAAHHGAPHGQFPAREITLVFLRHGSISPHVN